MSECIMDYPQAWEWTRASKMEDHDPKCSWVQARLLCDCRVLWDEYDRRRAMGPAAPQPHNDDTGGGE